MLRLALLVWLMSAACGSGGRPAQPIHLGEDHLGLHPGESMGFEVTVGGILVGNGYFRVGLPRSQDVAVLPPEPTPTAPARPRVITPARDVLAHTHGGYARLRQAAVMAPPPAPPPPPGPTTRTTTAIEVETGIASAGAAALIKIVHDASVTLVDLTERLPLAYAANVRYGKQAFTAEATFTGSRVHVAWHNLETKKDSIVRFDFRDKPPLDTATAMARLRVWRGQPGDTREVYVVGGRRMWRSDLTWRGNEIISTRFGNRSATRLDGVSYRIRSNMEIEGDKPMRAFTVWLSDDADRVPLRVRGTTELGALVLELVEYARPTD